MNRYKLSKAGVSANDGIARFNGDKDMFERVLMGFKEDINYANLSDAIKAKDVKAAFSAAHSLKGVAGNLSLTRLYDDVYPLVEELRAGRFDQVDEMMIKVTADYEAVMAVLG